MSHQNEDLMFEHEHDYVKNQFEATRDWYVRRPTVCSCYARAMLPSVPACMWGRQAVHSRPRTSYLHPTLLLQPHFEPVLRVALGWHAGTALLKTKYCSLIESMNGYHCYLHSRFCLVHRGLVKHYSILESPTIQPPNTQHPTPNTQHPTPNT